MAAAKGNKYWEQRKTHGRGKAIESPDVLWQHACDYFQKCDDNPWVRVDFKGKDIEKVEIPTAVPYTWDGLDDHLFENNVIAKLEDYKANKEGNYKDFSDIITRIGKIIRDRKMTGAIVGVYNSNIIARDLGLGDKAILEGGDKPIKTIDYSKLSTETLKEISNLPNVDTTN